MKGTIIMINEKRGFIAVQTKCDISVIELLGGYIVELEDVVSGDLESEGSDEIMNITQDEEMDVFIQATGCSKACAYKMLLE